MIYVLILIAGIDTAGVSVTNVEFENRKACMAAGNALKEKWLAIDSDHAVEFVCAPKR